MYGSIVVILLLIIIIFATYWYFFHEIGLIETNLKLLGKSAVPTCIKSLVPDICEPFRSPIDITDDPAINVGKFIAYLGTKNKKLLGSNYRLIYWAKDNIPIAVQYGNYVIFRGTLTGADFLEDLNFAQQNERDGVKVHAGFDKIYQNIKKQFILDQTKPVFITGHSLGCALALLLAFDCNNVTVVNYAPPRTGNAAFAKKLDPYVTSYINEADIVPTLPPSYIAIKDTIYQYSHVGEIKYFNSVQPDLLACHAITTYL
jgi:hypothetical protein